MSNKVFVGGLSWDTTDTQLGDAFGQFGQVSESIVITDRDTNRSRGFGFVTFSDSQSAQDAIANMDGTTLDGRTINVNIARERQDRSRQNNNNNRW